MILSAFLIGALARFALPGPDPMPFWLTVLFGLGGSLVGGGIAAVAYGVGHVFDSSGHAFVTVLLEIGAADVLLAVYRRYVQRRPRTGQAPTPFPHAASASNECALGSASSASIQTARWACLASPPLSSPHASSQTNSKSSASSTTRAPSPTRNTSEHGTASALLLGPVSGFLLDDLYIAGDTVWYEGVEETIERHAPRVAVVNAGGAEFTEGGLIIMGVDDVREVGARVPTVVAVHLEALNHCFLTRAALREALPDVLVPQDGETLEL